MLNSIAIMFLSVAMIIGVFTNITQDKIITKLTEEIQIINSKLND